MEDEETPNKKKKKPLSTKQDVSNICNFPLCSRQSE